MFAVFKRFDIAKIESVDVQEYVSLILFYKGIIFHSFFLAIFNYVIISVFKSFLMSNLLISKCVTLLNEYK